MTNEESPRKAGRSHPVARILQIGNYPPPVCGWAIHAQAVQNALQKRGAICKVLDIGPGRRTREEGPDCTPMRGAWDYLRKIIAYRLRGFTFEPHVNGESWQGYLLVLGAVLLGRVTGKPSVLMFHAGPTQRYFPRSSGFWRYAFSILFHASGAIVCNFESVQEEIVKYGLPPEKVHPIFSAVYDSEAIPVSLPEELNAFLRVHEPRLFSYSMFRPGYGTECMLAAFSDLRETFSRAGLLIVGPPEIRDETRAELRRLKIEKDVFITNNMPRAQFLTAIQQSDVFVRTPTTDGLCASVLEALRLRVPVIAAENYQRPESVVRFSADDPQDLRKTLDMVLQNLPRFRASTKAPDENKGLDVEVELLMETVS